MSPGFGYSPRRMRSTTMAAEKSRMYKEKLKSTPGEYQRYQTKCREAMRRLREKRRLERMVVMQSVVGGGGVFLGDGVEIPAEQDGVKNFHQQFQ
ncbi:hypothetical protein ACOMHN_036043 [Nucella lapillus]